jgi:hypothetical protein
LHKLIKQKGEIESRLSEARYAPEPLPEELEGKQRELGDLLIQEYEITGKVGQTEIEVAEAYRELKGVLEAAKRRGRELV